MTDKLNFLVKKDLWLTAEKEPEFKVLGWTTTKPKFDNGHIKKNNVLIYSHMYEDALNFIMIIPGPIYDSASKPELFQSEIESLINEGALELIQMNEIVEATIVPGFPELTQGAILIRESKEGYRKDAILPQSLDMVMGIRENRQSQGAIQPGEKISLRHILDTYTTAIGRRLISK